MASNRRRSSQPPRTLLEQLIREREATYGEQVDEFNRLAQEHGEHATMTVRHLQRLAAGQGSANGAVPSTRRVMRKLYGRPLDQLLAGPPPSVSSSPQLERQVSLPVISRESSASADQEELAERGTVYPKAATTAVELLSTLAEGDLTDHPHVAGARWASNVAPQVITGYMFAGPIAFAAEPLTAVQGVALAERIRATAASLMEMDFQRGGGHVRRMLLHYFRDEVVPELCKSRPSGIRRELFSAAAEVAQLLGWSAYDSGRHGAAMRYFIQGLRIAQEAEDHMLGGRLLSNLSHQANFLGNFDDALMFARAAQGSTHGRATRTVETMFLMMEARALANVGDRRTCALTLHRAEQLFEKRQPGGEPRWISYYDDAELAGDTAHLFRDLGMAEQTKDAVSRALVPNTPPRTRAFINMVSAATSLRAGHADEATALARHAAKQASGLQSARYRQYVADFEHTLAQCGFQPV